MIEKFPWDRMCLESCLIPVEKKETHEFSLEIDELHVNRSKCSTYLFHYLLFAFYNEHSDCLSVTIALIEKEKSWLKFTFIFANKETFEHFQNYLGGKSYKLKPN